MQVYSSIRILPKKWMHEIKSQWCTRLLLTFETIEPILASIYILEHKTHTDKYAHRPLQAQPLIAMIHVGAHCRAAGNQVLVVTMVFVK